MSPARADFDLRHLASLARLRLSDDDAAAFARQLPDILAYADVIRGVPTDGVPPMTHVLAPAMAERPDVEAPSLPRETALANAPDAAGGLFRVPAVLP